jgi:hypothetical protein
MKPIIVSLLKNLILLTLVVITVFAFLNGMFSWKNLFAIQIAAGFVYVFLSCYEYMNASYKAQLPVKRYAYFPYSFFMFKTMKAFFFFSFAIMLITSGTRVKYLYMICVIIAVTELMVMFLRYRRKLCFVSLYANYILFSRHIMFKVFANEIESVQFRHGIFYIILKNKKAHDIRLIHVENKDEFLLNFKEWLAKNNLIMNAESQTNLSHHALTVVGR